MSDHDPIPIWHLWAPTSAEPGIQFGCTPITAMAMRMIDGGWIRIPPGEVCPRCQQLELFDE